MSAHYREKSSHSALVWQPYTSPIIDFCSPTSQKSPYIIICKANQEDPSMWSD